MRKFRKNLSLMLSVIMLSQTIGINSVSADVVNKDIGNTASYAVSTNYNTTANNDYSDHWAAATIEKLINESIITGYSDGSIKPDNEISRAEFVTLVNKLFGYTEKASTNFSDVELGAWYTDQFAIAKKAGYVSGDNYGHANPTDNITRAEVCSIIARALDLESISTTSFTDNSDIPSWAKGYIGALYEAGIISGYPDGSFGADRNITRAEAFTIINNTLEYGIQPTHDNEDNNITSSRGGNNKTETTEEATETTTKRRSSGGGGGSSGSSGSTNTNNIYYTVTFDANGAGNVSDLPEAQAVKSGEYATVPSTPTRPNYIFEGWYTDSSLENEYNFSTAVTSNITLYAKWKSTLVAGDPDADYSVTFLLNDGSAGVYELQQVKAYETAAKPSDPVRNNYGFTGWYTESQTAVKFDFSTPIEADLILYAGWGAPDGSEGLYTADFDRETIYSVSGIEMGDKCVNVTINTNSTSVLVVSFLDEDTDELLNTVALQTPSYCEFETVTVPVEFSLPQHYKISAVLVDENENALCEPYVCIKYTSKFEVFESKTINDFEEDRVINFDEDDSYNFGVITNDVKIIEVGEITNVFEVNEIEVEGDVIPDFEYVFENPDLSVKSLKENDKVYLDGTVYLFKVGSIETDANGTITVIPSEDAALDEFYDFLKVKMSYEDTETDNDSEIQTYSKIVDKNGKLESSLSSSISWSPANKSWLNVTGSISGKIGIELELYYDVKLFKSNEFYLSIITTKSFTLKVEAVTTLDNSETVKDELDAAKVHFPTPVPGVYVYVAVTLPTEWKLTAKIGATYTSTTKSGFKYSSLYGKSPIESKQSSFKITTFEGAAELKFGPKFEVGLTIIGNIVKVNLGAQMGVKITATASVHSLEGIHDEDTETLLQLADEIHACGLCIDGQVKIFFDISASASAKITNAFKWSASITILNAETAYKFGDNKPGFYFSVLNALDSMFEGEMHFGAGTCPNKNYRTTIMVRDADGNDISDNTIDIVKANGYFDKHGKSTYVVYLYDGIYTAATDINGTAVAKRFTVSGAAQEILLKPDSADGKLEGKIVDSATNAPISDAYIVITNGDVGVTAKQSKSDGSFTIPLPEGSYNVSITKDGYIPFSSYIFVDNAQTTYMETVKLVQGENKSGGFSGTIYDAVTGNPVEGVSLKVRKGWNNSSEGEVVKVLTTDSNGRYNCTANEIFGIIIGLESGNYTVTASKTGYITTSFNVVVLPEVSDNGGQNSTITPEGSDGQYRIVLTWGENPRDLDSHVVGSLSSGGTFHVYFSNKTANDGNTTVCNLDVDETNGGTSPETITLVTTNSEPYYYYVYRYAGAGTVASSGARVEVYSGNQRTNTFYVPTNLGDGDYWNVFAIVNGKLVIRNTITSDSELSYAGGNLTTYSVDEDLTLFAYDTTEEDTIVKKELEFDNITSDLNIEDTVTDESNNEETEALNSGSDNVLNDVVTAEIIDIESPVSIEAEFSEEITDIESLNDEAIGNVEDVIDEITE